jgi:serine/threonine protein kinase
MATQTSDANAAVRFKFDSKPHGQGGFGKVIKGRDNALERDVAVKVLNPLLTQFSEEERERFKREARILARLSHPNTPAVYDVVFGPDQFLIICQFVDGRTLRKILEDEGPVDITKVQSWFRQIASALEHAHAIGIVHRDVKPENIIITPDGESAYLVDWGIALSAQEAKRLTQTGGWIGTPGYMSPEQQAGEEVGASSDIFSLAVTLYEALAGKPIPQGHYQELSLINQAIPPSIDELVHACLEPKERRLDSARTFATRLIAALAPARPLSEVLSHGRLHEIAATLRELTADTFMRLPEGQRALILVKLDDIVGSEDPNLSYATAEFLELLILRGLLLDKDSYSGIAAPAFNRAFEKDYEGRLGRRSLQQAIESAAAEAHGDAFDVLATESVKFVQRTRLDDKPGWFLQALRGILQALMANPSCTKGARELATALRAVNASQTRRPQLRFDDRDAG